MKFSSDIRDKIKTFIKDKLIEINAYVDDELPEYIVVLASHRKPRNSIIEDLKLFLGRNTEKFVDWLNHILENLESSNVEDKKKTSQVFKPRHNDMPNPINDATYFQEEDKSVSADELYYEDDKLESSGVSNVNKDDYSSGFQDINKSQLKSFMDEICTNSAKNSAEISKDSLFKHVVINRTDFDENEKDRSREKNTNDGDLPPIHVTFRNDINPVDKPEHFEDHQESNTSDAKGNKILERCKFWPICKHGDSCQYHHPNKMCNTFPNCKFGDKCIYIHPNCTYDASCLRANCPFNHTTKNRNPVFVSRPIFRVKRGRVMAYRGLNKRSYKPHKVKKCKFGSECANREQCPFSHGVQRNARYSWTRPVGSDSNTKESDTVACNVTEGHPPAK